MTAPTKQALPAAEQDPADAKQADTPYGCDVEEAALELVRRAHLAAAGEQPLDRYRELLWQRLAYLRAAELLHDVARGEPLSELAGWHTYREIEVMLREQGTPASDSTITKLVRAWRAWRAAASRR